MADTISNAGNGWWGQAPAGSPPAQKPSTDISTGVAPTVPSNLGLGSNQTTPSSYLSSNLNFGDLINQRNQLFQDYLSKALPSQNEQDMRTGLAGLQNQALLASNNARQQGETLGFAQGFQGEVDRRNNLLLQAQANSLNAVTQNRQQMADVYQNALSNQNQMMSPYFNMAQAQYQQGLNLQTAQYQNNLALSQKYADAGILPTDDQETIMRKLSGSAAYKAGFVDITSGTDLYGRRYAIAIDKRSGQILNTYTSPMPNDMNPNGNPPSQNGPSGQLGPSGPTNSFGASYNQYGLLANTNFNPSNNTDSFALNYLRVLLTEGRVPTSNDAGISQRGLGGSMIFNQVRQRANDLYYAATGQSLPNPAIIKNYIGLVNTNNDMANRVATQEQTVRANVDLSLDNMNKNGLNSSGFKPLDGLINTVRDAFQDPNVGQFLSQNATIQNELGSLLAVKNASGTTVFDKLASAGIISPNDSPEVMQQKVNTLLQEASNFADAINKVNADLYGKIDPLQMDPNNPARNKPQTPDAPQGGPSPITPDKQNAWDSVMGNTNNSQNQPTPAPTIDTTPFLFKLWNKMFKS